PGGALTQAGQHRAQGGLAVVGAACLLEPLVQLASAKPARQRALARSRFACSECGEGVVAGALRVEQLLVRSPGSTAVERQEVGDELARSRASRCRRADSAEVARGLGVDLVDVLCEVFAVPEPSEVGTVQGFIAE